MIPTPPMAPRAVSKPKSGLTHVYERVAQAAFCILALAVPLAYFPWTTDALEINKQTITIILVTVSVIAWLGMMVARREFVIKSSYTFLLAAGFILSALAASAMSLAPYVSFVGQSSQEYTSFLTLLVLALLFVTGSSFLSETKIQRVVWSLMLFSSAVVSLAVILATLGAKFIPTSFIGTPNSLGIYLAAMAVLGCGLMLVEGTSERSPVIARGAAGIFTRACAVITAIGATITLMILDDWSFWMVLLLGLALLFTFAVWRAEEFPRMGRFVLPMAMFVIAVVFLFLPAPLHGRFPSEVAPSASSGLRIATSTIKDGHWLFGSGPGTFVMDYAKFQSPETAKSAFWDTRFDRAGSHLITMLATFGPVGTLMYLLFVIGVFATAIKVLVTQRAEDEWKMTFVAFAGWMALLAGQIVYSSNFTLQFLFWLLSAVLVAQSMAPTKSIAFTKSPRLGLLTAFLLVMVSVGMLTVVFISVSRYAAEIAFAQAVRMDGTGEALDEIIMKVDSAARLNKWSDVYYRNLAQALLLKIGEAAKDEKTTPAQIQSLIAASFNAAKHSTELSPNQVVNWSLLGDFCRETAPIVGNADVCSISAYETAILLSPNNPKYFTSLGRSYLVAADLQAPKLKSEDKKVKDDAKAATDEAIVQAVEKLTRALELRPTYAPASYYLAAAYERQGNLAEAVKGIEKLKGQYPSDVGVAFRLGLLYIRQGKKDFAQKELERAVEIAPNYSDALWFLSSLYEEAGDYAKAIEAVNKVLDQNPDKAETINQRLDRLRNQQKPVAPIVPLEDLNTEPVTP